MRYPKDPKATWFVRTHAEASRGRLSHQKTMNPEKMEDFHMDLLGNLREHYQESVESDMWLCPKMRRTRKNASFIGKMVRIHWNCGVALIFLANPYVF